MIKKDNVPNKFKVLLDFERGDTSLSQAANTLEARTASDVMKMLVAYREHLPYLIDASERLAMQHHTQTDRREIVEEVAAKLGITPRQVNRMMKSTNITTPSPYRVILRSMKREGAQEKWKIRFRGALSVISGSEAMDAAAEQCEVCSRQMYRWVTKLLETEKITLKDIKTLPIGRRRDIADDIERKQEKNFELQNDKPRATAEAVGA